MDAKLMEETVTWAMVKFKVAKSRYLVRHRKFQAMYPIRKDAIVD